MPWKKEDRPTRLATQLSVLSDSVDSLPSSCSSRTLCSTVLCFDRLCRAFVTLQFDPSGFGDFFNNEGLTMKHR